VIVGVVALPLAIAFAIASGVTPDRGLYTAIIAGFLISARGGSRVQIGGPTGAFVVIVYGIVHKYGVDGLIVATIMAGVILVILGVAKLGSSIKFIPHPVVVGFTSGIAVIIFSSQVKDFLGLGLGDLPVVHSQMARLRRIWIRQMRRRSPWGASLLIMILWPRVSHRIQAHSWR
jgi:SulP family sulfate permease